jgi:antirestriction protein ArdC
VRWDHAVYSASWLKVLWDDRRAILSAAAHVLQAVDYLHGPQVKAEDRTA